MQTDKCVCTLRRRCSNSLGRQIPWEPYSVCSIARTVSGAHSHPDHRSRCLFAGAPLASFAHFGSIGDGSEGTVEMGTGNKASMALHTQYGTMPMWHSVAFLWPVADTASFLTGCFGRSVPCCYLDPVSARIVSMLPVSAHPIRRPISSALVSNCVSYDMNLNNMFEYS